MTVPLSNIAGETMSEKKMTIREYLDKHETITYGFKGISMLPMLRQEKDLVILRKYNGKGLKKYDVAMYDLGGNRRNVLHRVVEVQGDHYTFLGDNCWNKEKQIPESSIVAVLEAFIRDGKVIPVTNLSYRIYARVHYFLYPARIEWRKFKVRAAKVPLLKKIWHIIKRKPKDK